MTGPEGACSYVRYRWLHARSCAADNRKLSLGRRCKPRPVDRARTLLPCTARTHACAHGKQAVATGNSRLVAMDESATAAEVCITPFERVCHIHSVSLILADEATTSGKQWTCMQAMAAEASLVVDLVPRLRHRNVSAMHTAPVHSTMTLSRATTAKS